MDEPPGQPRALLLCATRAERQLRLIGDLGASCRGTGPHTEGQWLEPFDQSWGERYPMIAQAWRCGWQHMSPFLALPDELRRVVYTTNTIEAMHSQIRKVIKTRGHFPDEQAANKLIYIAIERAETKWRSARSWIPALTALKIHLGDRLPD